MPQNIQIEEMGILKSNWEEELAKFQNHHPNQLLVNGLLKAISSQVDVAFDINPIRLLKLCNKNDINLSLRGKQLYQQKKE